MKEWIKKTAVVLTVVGTVFALGYGCSRPREIRGQDMLYKYDANKDGILDIVTLSPDIPGIHKRCLVWYDGRNVEEYREKDGMKVYRAHSTGNIVSYNLKDLIDCNDWCGAYDKASKLP